MSELRTLPPLPAVRAFEAAARRGNFTIAAEEIGMTQAAISYQIRQLEDRIGTRLFHRRPRGVELTETGRRFATVASEALNLLRSGYAEAQQRYSNRLLISALPSFAVSVLAPLLGAFQLAHPEISSRVVMDSDIIDLSEVDEIAVALRAAREVNDDNLIAHDLMEVTYSPMLSPKLLKEHGPIHEPADLLRLPRIDEHDSIWRVWFEAAGVPQRAPDADDNHDHLYGVQVMEARATVSGHGVSLLTPNFFRSELENGTLLRPFDIECSIGLHMWLVYAKRLRQVPAIRGFRDWILAELMREFGDAPLDAPADSP